MSNWTVALRCASACLLMQWATSTTARAEDFASWETPRLYNFATSKLKDGRGLLKAIEALEIASKRDPKSLDTQIALGCAYSSRYASVAMARKQSQRYPNESAYYESRKKKWDEAHAATDQPGSQRPPPIKPPAPSTPDDDALFTLQDDQAIVCLRKLGNSAQNAFSEAVHLAEDVGKSTGSDTAKVKDRDALERTNLARGWGLLLIKRFGKDIVQDTPPDPKSKSVQEILYIPDDDIIASFRRLTEIHPDEAVGWYSLAVALAPKCLSLEEGFGGIAYGQTFEKSDRLKSARDAITHSLSLKPNDFQALYTAGLLYRPTDIEAAIRFLERAADRSGDNAVLRYQVADLLFEQAETAKDQKRSRVESSAWEAVERGNKARRYSSVRLKFPAPPFLHRAWESAAPYGLRDDYVVRQVGVYLNEIAKAADAAGDDATLLKSATAQIAMSLKVLEASQGEDLDYRDTTARTVYGARRALAVTFIVGPYVEVRNANKYRADARKERFLVKNAALAQQMREWEQNAD